MSVERIWLTRHAETSDPRVFHGADSDIGLSELGARQSEAAARFYADLRVTAVVSSAMLRARLTAGPIAAACEVPHQVEPELYERRIGRLAGQPFDGANGAWPDTVRAWESGDLDFTTLGAESFRDLRTRLMPAFERVVDAYPGGRVVVVAHGIVCKVILLTLLDGFGPAGWTRLGRVANLAFTELVPNPGGWRAEQLLNLPAPVDALAGATGLQAGPRVNPA